MKQITNKTERMLEIESILNCNIEGILRSMYVDANYPVTLIAKTLGVSYVTANKWLNMAGIKSRRINFEEVDK